MSVSLLQKTCLPRRGVCEKGDLIFSSMRLGDSEFEWECWLLSGMGQSAANTTLPSCLWVFFSFVFFLATVGFGRKSPLEAEEGPGP